MFAWPISHVRTRRRITHPGVDELCFSGISLMWKHAGMNLVIGVHEEKRCDQSPLAAWSRCCWDARNLRAQGWNAVNETLYNITRATNDICRPGREGKVEMEKKKKIWLDKETKSIQEMRKLIGPECFFWRPGWFYLISVILSCLFFNLDGSCRISDPIY